MKSYGRSVLLSERAHFKRQITKQKERNSIFEETVDFKEKYYKIRYKYLKNRALFYFIQFSKSFSSFSRYQVTANFNLQIEIPNKTNAARFEEKSKNNFKKFIKHIISNF